MTDETLMLAVRDGDKRKLGILFERHHRPLYEFFCRMTGNRSASEDLVQDVFVRILKYRQTYRAESRFTTWMYRIARNAGATYFGSRRTETFLSGDLESVADNSVSVSRFGVTHNGELVRQALLMLPEDRRELLVLARYQGMKHGEIAELLGIDTGAVKVRLHRAMNELRAVILKLSGEPPLWNVGKSKSTLRIM